MKLFKIAGIAVLSLGIVHILATPIVLPMFNSLNKSGLLTFSYMFVATGIAMVFTGWLQYYIAKQTIINHICFNILKISVLFVSISGIGAVATMCDNPFAYIILIVALWEIILLVNYWKNKVDEAID